MTLAGQTRFRLHLTGLLALFLLLFAPLTSFASYLPVASGGNIGIGTTTATEKLEVIGTVKATRFIGDGTGLTGVTFSQWTDVAGGIYYDAGNVGIGTSVPLGGSRLDVQGGTAAGSKIVNINGSFADLNGARAGLYVDVTADTAGPGGPVGSWSQVRTTADSGTYTYVVTGAYGEALHSGSADAAHLVGVMATANQYGTSDLTNAYGFYPQVWKGGGTLTNAYGLFYQGVPPTNPDPGSASGGNVLNQYGIAIGKLDTATTRNIGLLLDDASIGATAAGNFGIFEEAGDPNYFTGNIGIGSSAPDGKLVLSESAAVNTLEKRVHEDATGTYANETQYIVGKAGGANRSTPSDVQNSRYFTWHGSFQEVAKVAVTTPTVNAGTVVGAMDFYTQNTGGLVKRMTLNELGAVFQNGNVGIASTLPQAKLDVQGGDVIIGTGTPAHLTDEGDAYITGTLQVDGDVYLGNALTDNLVVAGSLTLAGDTTYTGPVKIKVDNANAFLVEQADGDDVFQVNTLTGALTLSTALTVPNGGTGATSLTGVLKGNGVNAFTALTGTPGYVTRWADADTLGSSVIYDNGVNIGIGSAAPAQKLDVTGDVYVNGNIGIGTVTPGGKLAVIGGNVGIGTTNPARQLEIANATGGALRLSTGAYYADITKVRVAGANGWDGFWMYPGSGTYPLFAVQKENVVGTNDLMFQGYTNSSTANMVFEAYSSADLYVQTRTPQSGGGDIIFRTSAPESGPGNERLVILNSGNIGISSTAPQAKLDVEGNAYFGAGNVGIGTVAPREKLDVDGSIYASGTVTAGTLSIAAGSITDATGAISFDNENLVTTGTLQAGAGTLTSLYVSSGNVGIGSAAPRSLLDVLGGDVLIGTGTPTHLTDDGDAYITGNLQVDGDVYLGNALTDNLVVAGSLTLAGDTTYTGPVKIKVDDANAFLVEQADGDDVLQVNTLTGALTLSTALTVPNGGTGATSLAGVIKGNGAAAFTALTGTPGYITRWADATTLGDSVIYDSGANIGIGSSSPVQKLDVAGGAYFSGNVGIGTSGPATLFEVAGAGSGDFLGSPGLAVLRTFNSTPWHLVLKNDQAGADHIGMVRLDHHDNISVSIGTGGGSYVTPLVLNPSSSTLDGSFTVTQDLYVDATAMFNGPVYGYEVNGKLEIFGDTTATQGVSILNNGNVGISSAAPQARLDVEGNVYVGNGNVGIGSAAPRSLLDVLGGDVLIGTGTPTHVTDDGDAYITGNLQVDGDVYLGDTLTDNLVVAGSLTLAGDTTYTGPVKIKVDNANAFLVEQADGDDVLQVNTLTGALTLSTALTVPNGGTGVTSLTGVVKGNGAAAFTALTGTPGYVTRWADADTLGSSVIYDSGVNVGIGSVAPAQKLDVTGSIYVSGNVGVGTAAPSAKLSIVSTTAGQDILSVTPPGGYAANQFKVNEFGQVTVSGASSAGEFNVSGRTHLVGSTADSSSYALGVWDFSGITSLLYVRNDGNVGISSSVPQAQLDVEGSAYFGNGNIGVGSGEPSQKVDVVGTVKATAFIGDGSGLTNVPNEISGLSVGYLTKGATATTIDSSAVYQSTDGNIGIGSSAPAQKLDVTGSVYVNGNVGIGTSVPGALLNVGEATPTTAAYGLQFGADTSANLYRSSAGRITTDGSLTLGGGITVGSGLVYSGSGNALRLAGGGSSTAAWGDVMIQTGNTKTFTSGTAQTLTVSMGGSGFAPTSGTGVFNTLEVQSIINQTGGASGVTRGLYVNPTLTSAYDWRAIEIGTTNASGYAIYSAAATPVYFDGNLGIGSAVPSQKVDVLGTVRATAFIGDGAGLTNVPNEISGLGVGYLTKGASPTSIDSSAVYQSAANNIGIGSTAPAQTLDVAGSVYVNGNVGIGTASPGGLLQVGAGPAPGILVGPTGNVGIGTSSLAYPLRIGDDFYFTSGGTMGGGQLYFWTGSFTPGGSGGTVVLTTNGAAGQTADIQNWGRSGAGTYAVVNSVGWFGIGSTAPQAELDVEGSVYFGDGGVSSSNVGVGTTAPVQKVEVIGTVKATAFIGDGSGLTGVGSQWTTNGTAIYYNTGNVGVGTSAPGEKLEVGAAAGTDSGLYLSDNDIDHGMTLVVPTNVYGYLSQLQYQSGGLLIGGIVNSGYPGSSALEMRGSTQGAGTAISLVGTDVGAGETLKATGDLLQVVNFDATTASNIKFVVQAGGNVGIGTEDPAGLLHVSGGLTTTGAQLFLETEEPTVVANDVVGTIEFRGLDSDSRPAVRIRALATGAWGNDTDSAGTALQFFTQDNTNASALGSPRMVITGDGNVGVGTSVPQANFGVQGSLGIPWDINWDVSEGYTFNDGSLRKDYGLYHSPINEFNYGVYVAAPSSVAINIDANNNETGNLFKVSRDGYSITGGTELFRVQEDGNVGIGTSAPLAKLELVGAGTTSATKALQVRASDGTSRVTVLDNGNVGIGTSDPESLLSAGANSAFQVESSGAISKLQGGNVYINFGGIIGYNSTMSYVNYSVAAGSNTLFSGGSTDDGFIEMRSTLANGTSDYIKFTGGNNGATEIMRLLGTGRVGIGSTAPQAKLDVEGSVYFGDGGVSSSNVGVGTAAPVQKVEVVGTVKATAFIGDGSGLTGVGSQWTTNGTMIYYNTGNVGIGTTDATVALDVSGEIAATGNITTGNFLLAGSVRGGHAGNQVDPTFQGGTGNHSGIFFSGTDVAFSANSLERMRLTGAGNFGIGSSAPQARLDVEGSVYVGDGGAAASGNIGVGSAAPTQKVDVIGTVKATAFIGDGSGLTGIGGSISGLTPGYHAKAATATTIADSLIYDNGTNVGIGTSAPNDLLEVGSGLFTVDTSGNAIANGSLTSNGGVYGNNGSINTSWETGTLLVGTSTAPSGGVATFNGNVGIGTNGPRAKLDVEGNVYVGNGNVGIGTANAAYNFHQYSVVANDEPVFYLTANTDAAGYGVGSLSISNYYNSGKLTWNGDGDVPGFFIYNNSGNIKITAKNLYSPGVVIGQDQVPNGGMGAQLGTGTTGYYPAGGEYAISGTRELINPTSNDTIINSFGVYPTINQTGTASGITRGIYINPTLTSAVDWRSLEIANNSGFAIHQTGANAKNSFAGNVGIGSTAPQQKVDVIGTVKATAFIGDGSGLTGIGGSISGLTPGYHAKAATATTIADSLIYDNGTNVGIGSTVPQQKLEVVGTVKATAFIGDGSGLTGLASGSQWTTSGTAIYYNTGNVGIGSSVPQARLEVSDNAYFSGNIGIGTTAPAAKMEANGQYFSRRYSATTSIDWSNGNVQAVQLASGANVITFTGAQPGGRYLLEVKQPSGGAAGTVTWDGSVKWSGGIAPTLTATNSRTDIVTFFYNGTNYAGSFSLNYDL